MQTILASTPDVAMSPLEYKKSRDESEDSMNYDIRFKTLNHDEFSAPNPKECDILRQFALGSKGQSNDYRPQADRPSYLKTRIALIGGDSLRWIPIKDCLEGIFLQVDHLNTASEFLQAEEIHFDLLVLDFQSLGGAVVDIIRAVRRCQSHWIPIVLIMERADDDEVLQAYRQGADAHMSRPVRQGELVARVRALLRRSATFGKYRFEADEMIVYLGNTPIRLGYREFAVARHLFVNLGRSVPRSHLLKVACISDIDSSARSLDSLISRLRRNLSLSADNGLRIRSEYRIGYRLEQIRVSSSQIARSHLVRACSLDDYDVTRSDARAGE